MKGRFALIWEQMLRSSLWIKGSKETRLVWITLLVLKNADGDVFAPPIGLADAAKVSLDECKRALEELSAPDEDSRTQIKEGRRIEPIEGGWHIINHDLYRFSTDAKRAFWADQKAKQRDKQKKGKKAARIKGGIAERTYVKAMENGASPEELDDIVTNSLPEGLREEPPAYTA